MISGHVRLTLLLFSYFKYKWICFWLKRFSNENKILNSDTSKTSKYYFDVWSKLSLKLKMCGWSCLKMCSRPIYPTPSALALLYKLFDSWRLIAEVVVNRRQDVILWGQASITHQRWERQLVDQIGQVKGGKERGKGGQPVSKLQLLRIVGSAKSSCILTQHININDTYIIRSKIDQIMK